MRTTTAYHLEYAEINNPLTTEEENLINQNFKNCYSPQIIAWALCQKSSGRKKLFDFLRCKDPKKPTRPMTSFAPSKKDLIIQSSTCRIDLTSTMGYHRPTRRLNVNRFASNGIIGDQIFGDCKAINSPKTPRNETSTLAQFIIKKLIKADKVEHFMGKSEINLDFLQTLNQFVDRKTYNFPVDNLRNHPTLDPGKERTVNRRTNREDHLTRVGGPPQPYEVKAKPRLETHPWKTPTSAYSDFFPADPRYGTRTITTAVLPPVEQSQPFCKFPESGIKVERTPKISPAFVKQAKEDSIRNRKYKEIFESKTVL